MKRWLTAACTGFLLAQAAPLSAQPEAVSADGRWRLQAAPGVLAVVEVATGQRVKTLRVAALDGTAGGEVAEIHALPARRSFVVVFTALPEMWEVSHDPKADPVFDGLVHDYKMGEGIAIPGFLNPRRTRLETPLRGLAFDRSQGFVLGRAGDRADRRAVLQVWQLDVRRRIGELAVAGDPDPARARAALRDGREGVEVPDRAGGAAIFVDWRRP